MESPVFVQPDPQEKKGGRKRKYPKLIETNPLPVKVFELGKCVAEGDWEHLEIRRDCLDKPLVIEAVSRRVFPNESIHFGIMERLSMPRSFLGALAGQAKSAETKILCARCPASNRFVPDEDVDLSIINYMSE